MGSAREEILGKLKNAIHPEAELPDLDSPIYHSINEPLDITFKESLEAVNGSVYLCHSPNDAFQTLKELINDYSQEQIFCLEKHLQGHLTINDITFSKNLDNFDSIEVGITSCEFLIAHTGTVMVSSALEGGRQMSIYPPKHIVIARREQVVDYLNQAYSALRQKYHDALPSHVALITGPSRTADIEKTLVMGAHGPKELHVFVY